MDRNILITGASSGIGRALALHYSAAGVRLGLLGRNLARLDAVANECRQRGANVVTASMDVCDRAAVAAWLTAFDGQAPLDLIVANAGVMAGTPPDGDIEPADTAYALMQTNVLGVMNVVQPAIAVMLPRGRGQIAVMSSIAAFVPIADAPSYAASKSAVLSYALSLRLLLAPRGIQVSAICPGYVETPMMDQESGPKPQKMSAEQAAAIIARGLARNRPTVVFPFAFAWFTRIGGHLPEWIGRHAAKYFRFTVSAR